MDPHTLALANTLSRFWPLWMDAPGERCTWSPDVDVFERNETVVVRIDLPGTPPSAVHVEISEDEVTISGERKPELHRVGDVWSHAERGYGCFRRAIPLPVGAWPQEARATFADGVLEIDVPVMAPEIRTVSESAPQRTTLHVFAQPTAS